MERIYDLILLTVLTSVNTLEITLFCNLRSKIDKKHEFHNVYPDNTLSNKLYHRDNGF